jgi:protein gp37
LGTRCRVKCSLTGWPPLRRRRVSRLSSLSSIRSHRKLPGGEPQGLRHPGLPRAVPIMASQNGGRKRLCRIREMQICWQTQRQEEGYGGIWARRGFVTLHLAGIQIDGGSSMSSRSQIEWTEATWNPTRGCSRVSPGCGNCYAARFAHRLGGPGKPYEGLTRATESGPQWTGRVKLARKVLDLPLRWRSPRLVFVDSMSDLFHEKVPLSYIDEVFAVMERAGSHTFQVLTKRAERLSDLAPRLRWPPNVWMGVSIESEEYTYRSDLLAKVPAHTRFLSLEPLLGRIQMLPLEGVHWVIVGGESGPGARRINAAWVREIREVCCDARVPFFFKQWGGLRKSKNGRRLDGQTWDEMPACGRLGREQVGLGIA